MKTPQEYREKVQLTTTVRLPSGLECQIRPVPTMIILGLTENAAKDKASLQEYLNTHYTEALDEVIPSSVVSPKMLPSRKLDSKETSEDALFIDELIIGDIKELFVQIVKISGIAAEEIEKYETFPVDPDGKSTGPDGLKI